MTFKTYGKTIMVKLTLEEMKKFQMSELFVLKALALAVKQKIELDEKRSAFTMVQFKELSFSFVTPDYEDFKHGSETMKNFTVEEMEAWNLAVKTKKKAAFAILQKLVEKGLVRKSEINKKSRRNYYGRTMTSYYGFSHEGKNYLKSIVKGQSR